MSYVISYGIDGFLPERKGVLRLSPPGVAAGTHPSIFSGWATAGGLRLLLYVIIAFIT